MTSRRSKRITLISFACLLLLAVGHTPVDAAQGTSGWRTAYLTQSAVLDVVMMEDGAGWAVGEAGTILRYDGQSWGQVASPTDETLHAVDFASPDEGWAVGEGGTLLHYAGSDWQPFTAPTTDADEIFDITFVDGVGWAVGQRFNTAAGRFDGLILHLSDGAWMEVSIPQTESLYAVAFAAPDDGWAVGESSGAEATVLRWDGSEWMRSESIPPNVDLRDVATIGDEVWAVGERGVIAHWEEDGIQIISTQYDVTLTSVAFGSADAGWSVGVDGTILRYNGGLWTLVKTDLPLQPDLQGLYVGGDGIPWVTGDGGLIGRVTPGGWEFVVQPYVNVDLTSIDVGAGTSGWAVSALPFQPEEGVVFWQRAGEVWDPHQIRDAPPLFDVDVLTEDEAWAVGRTPPESVRGVVWHYDAGQWSASDNLDTSTLFAVEAVASDDVWVAGLDGGLLHYTGKEWQAVDIPENVHLYGLHFQSPDEGWAVGEEFDLVHEPLRYLPVALHYDGTSWEPTSVPDTAWPDTTNSLRRPRLLAVHALSEDNVWAVGNAGAILHFDGDEWEVVQGLEDYTLLDVDFAGPDDGWAVGTQGTVFRYQGGVWKPSDSGTTATLNGVASRPRGEAWAAGSGGTFLYRSPRPHMYLPLLFR